jgi:hypothetical protein
MEHRWNEIYREKPKYSGKNLSQCHFVHHKPQMDWPGIEPGLPQATQLLKGIKHSVGKSLKSQIIMK